MTVWVLLIDGQVVRVYQSQERAQEDDAILSRIQSAHNYWQIQEAEFHELAPSALVPSK